MQSLKTGALAHALLTARAKLAELLNNHEHYYYYLLNVCRALLMHLNKCSKNSQPCLKLQWCSLFQIVIVFILD